MTKRSFVSLELPIITMEGLIKILKMVEENKLKIGEVVEGLEKSIEELKKIRAVQLNEEHIEY